MKHVIKTALAFSALAGLAGCGLRGDLERPPPILTEPPTEETSAPVDSAVLFAGNDINEGTTYYNSLGGEIPKPAPTLEVEEESMGEVSPG
ncbi:MAG: lipoprotein [Hyphomonas sp.]|jgi:predicted small lipoprotein YifL|nr:lipoprotein [Hyphomonas sp.]